MGEETPKWDESPPSVGWDPPKWAESPPKVGEETPKCERRPQTGRRDPKVG